MDKKYLDRDFYQIVEQYGEKYVKVDGYYYETENISCEPDGRCVSYSGLEYKLSEFVEFVKANDNFRNDKIDDDASNCKQYIADVDLETEPNYYDTNPTELGYELLTMETSLGQYVDI